MTRKSPSSNVLLGCEDLNVMVLECRFVFHVMLSSLTFSRKGSLQIMQALSLG